MAKTKSNLKIAFIIFMVTFAVFLIMCGGSLQLLNPQWYKFRLLMKKESGLHICNKKLYNESLNLKLAELPNGKYRIGLSSEGYEMFYRHEPYDFEQVGIGIESRKQHKRYYVDSNGIERTISYYKDFRYTDIGFFIGGDEGAGIWLNYAQKIGCNENNKYIWVETVEQSYGEGGYAEADDGTIYRFNGGKINAK